MNKTAAAVFSAAAVAAAMLAGRRAGPQHPREAIWYSRLEKPSYTPSGPVIGATWTGLDILLGLSGARLLAARPGLDRSAALLFWLLNLSGVAGYPWLFFRQKKLGASALTVACMLASARASVMTASKVDRIAGLAGLPLVGWLAFAGLLGEELWRRNPS
jgi:translocator protein